MTAPFTHYLRVRYSECDAQQVVFNARYAEYADIAATEFMRAVWGHYDDVLAAGVDNQVVSLNINWRASAQFDDVIAVQVAVGHIGNTSYALDMKLLKHGRPTPLVDAVIADIRVTYVFVDAIEHTKTPIPEDMRTRLEQGAVGKVSNHAGIELA